MKFTKVFTQSHGSSQEESSVMAIKPKLTPEQKIENLGLRIEIERILKRYSIERIGQLTQHTEREISLLRGIAAGRVEEVKAALARNGLQLAPPKPKNQNETE